MDFNWYDYTIRPLRTSSYCMALLYTFWYFVDVALAIDMVYFKDYWADDDSQSIPDFMLASMTSYSAVHFMFTEFFQLVIIAKELTMNQFATAPNEDFETGKVAFFDINIDLLYWWGIDGNIEDYWEMVREFCRFYL